ncbi:hypothetical protein GQ457_17G013050 [Hibiscus cannabinus]
MKLQVKPDEDIKTMSDRFSTIVNGLKGYGEVILEDKLGWVVTYSFPNSPDSKKTTIIESKNLKTLKLDELIGLLLPHEMMSKGKEEKKKEVVKKNIGISLKSTKEESDSSGEDEENEMTMFAKRFKRLMNSIVEEEKTISKLKFKNDSLSKTNKEHESKIEKLQVKLNDFEKENKDLHDLLSKVHDDHQKKIGDLKASFNKVGAKIENCENSKPNYVKRNFNGYKHHSPRRSYNRKNVKSIWVPEGLIANKDYDILSKWIPQGTRLLGTNTYGPKRVWLIESSMRIKEGTFEGSEA